MPPLFMETLFGILDHPNIKFWWGYSSMRRLLTVATELLEELWPEKTKLGQIDHFYEIWVSSSYSSKYWAMTDKKKKYISRYSAGLGCKMQNPFTF